MTRTTIHNFKLKKNLKLGIVVLVMFNKMLVIVLLSTFTLDVGRDPKNPACQFVPICNTQCWVLILKQMSPEMRAYSAYTGFF